MSITRKELLQIYVPFVDQTDVRSGPSSTDREMPWKPTERVDYRPWHADFGGAIRTQRTHSCRGRSFRHVGQDTSENDGQDNQTDENDIPIDDIHCRCRGTAFFTAQLVSFVVVIKPV